MDALQIIEKLKALGLSEYEIAKRLKALALAKRIRPISQSTINRIATGQITNPSYRVWRELSSLLADLTITQGLKPSVARVSA
jgi:transcriptional regulator with XRE-family HTH domain